MKIFFGIYILFYEDIGKDVFFQQFDILKCDSYFIKEMFLNNSLNNRKFKGNIIEKKIGFNLHLNGEFKECGNMRTYEVSMHGCLLLSNKAGANAHNLIFEDQKEAVYYDNLDDAIEKINYYLSNDEERIKIAKRGFERAWKEYDYEKNLLNLLKWAEGLKS